MNNFETKSRENLSNGEKFILEKADKISSLIFDKLNHLGFNLPVVDDQYNLHTVNEIYTNLSPEITIDKNISREEKGQIVTNQLKKFLKGKVEMEIALYNGETEATRNKHKLIETIRKYINDLDVSPLREEHIPIILTNNEFKMSSFLGC